MTAVDVNEVEEVCVKEVVVEPAAAAKEKEVAGDLVGKGKSKREAEVSLVGEGLGDGEGIAKKGGEVEGVAAVVESDYVTS